jgi:hypothetical protein
VKEIQASVSLRPVKANSTLKQSHAPQDNSGGTKTR